MTLGKDSSENANACLLRLRQVVQALKIAGSDSRVKGLAARIGANEHFMGLAQVQELRNAVASFRCWQYLKIIALNSSLLLSFLLQLLLLYSNHSYVSDVGEHYRHKHLNRSLWPYTRSSLAAHQAVLPLLATEKLALLCDGCAGRSPVGVPQQ